MRAVPLHSLGFRLNKKESERRASFHRFLAPDCRWNVASLLPLRDMKDVSPQTVSCKKTLLPQVASCQRVCQSNKDTIYRTLFRLFFEAVRLGSGWKCVSLLSVPYVCHCFLIQKWCLKKKKVVPVPLGRLISQGHGHGRHVVSEAST